MRRFRIRHSTRYRFNGPVTLGTHRLLLRPREGHDLRIEQSTLECSPPATLRWHRDVDDNSVAVAEFADAADVLEINAVTQVQQFNEEPLDFVVSDFAVHYPFVLPEDDAAVLAPAMRSAEPEARGRLQAWLGGHWRAGERVQTYALLQRLCSAIHAGFRYQVREEPGVQTALQTLELGSGSCRDFAHLFMELVRLLGLPARFVSGYLHVPDLGETPGSTHAWAEVYLPGAGWTGFDPTAGVMAGADHFATAVARLPDAVPPVAGSFSGPLGAELTVGVWVTPV